MFRKQTSENKHANNKNKTGWDAGILQWVIL
jgi:hypothetical protein